MTSWRDSVLSFSALPAVGALLVSPRPAWVWSRDGDRILWANPAGGRWLGAEDFDRLQARRWAPGHPLRRDVEAAVRSLPEKGALARLRLSDRLPAIPVACNCRRLRTGAERGLLVVATEALSQAAFPADLESFFSGGSVRAMVLGLDRRAGPAGESDDADAAEAPHVEFVASDRLHKLILVESRPAPEAAPTEAPPAEEPPQILAQEIAEDAEPPSRSDEAAEPAEPQTAPAEDLTEEAAAEPDAPELREAMAAPHRGPRVIVVARPPKRIARGTGSAERRDAGARRGKPPVGPRQRSDVAAAPAHPAGAVVDGRGHETVPDGFGPAPAAERKPKLPPTSAAAESAEPAEPAEPARSVMAGRVPQELSRKPVRFLWQTDAGDRVLFVSPGLAQVVGRNAEIVGERFQDVSARLRLDPAQRIARALGQHDTWSGQTAWWPVEGSNVRVPAELTALPVFGGDHSFQGYRGFGVLKPAEALMPAAFEARFGPGGAEAAPAQQFPPYEEAVATVPANVVPIRADLERMADQHARLTPEERNAFEEIAAALRQRVEAGEPGPSRTEAAKQPEEPVVEAVATVEVAASSAGPDEERTPSEAASAAGEGRAAAAPDTADPAEIKPGDTPTEPPQDGLEAHAESREGAAPEPSDDAPPVKAVRPAGTPVPVRLRPPPRAHVPETDAERRLQEMTALLDTATDGVVVLDANGVIESASAGAAALFGLHPQELQGTKLGALLTAESRAVALDYLSGLAANGVASLLNEGREIEAEIGDGTIPLFMTVGRISGGDGRFCAVLRDITHWKRIEAELVAARRAAEAASTQKSEFLARVSHEIRTPLNAIIGFAEVMIEERFGPVENERYREYLRDIRTSGEHVVSLVNDLLDISKIEAGRLDLDFSAVPLNDLVRESIGLMQPQASRAQVVVRSSLSKEVPAIVADRRTLTQIVLNLLSNSVKFTAPGGQVIASTSLAETGEAVLRIRDTGEGMNEAELARALEPFRQIATAALADRTGTGLGLPLTKALVEANRASLAIKSARGEGTVVTVTFPATRVLSE